METQKSRKPISTRNQKLASKASNKSQKLLLYGLGIGTLLGGGYLLYKYLQDRAGSGGDTIIFNPKTTANSAAPKSLPITAATPSIVIQNKDQFPLKRGERGSLVVLLQKGLLAIGGSAAALIRQTSMKGSSPDGIFGSGTAKALLAAGFSTTVTESSFTRLLNMTTSKGASNSLVSGNQSLATIIIQGANSKNLFKVLSGLQKISDAKQYIAVSSFFKGVRILGTRVTSLVNALLSVAFKSNELGKIKIRAEFRRMGLLQNSQGIWSIPSLGAFETPAEVKSYVQQQQLYDIAITDRPTVLKTADGSFITPPLNPNVVVGYVVSSTNGVTQIIAANGETVYAPSNNLRLL